MKKLTGTVVLLIAMLSQGCQLEEKKSPNYFGNDFDNYQNWGFPHELLLKGDAHSGRYSCRTDGNSQFGIGMKLSSDELKAIKAKHMIVSAWVKCEKSRPKANIVATFDQGTNNVAWNGINLGEELTVNDRWAFVTARFDYPKNLSPGVDFTFFLWNTSGQTVLIDDMSVEFVK